MHLKISSAKRRRFCLGLNVYESYNMASDTSLRRRESAAMLLTLFAQSINYSVAEYSWFEFIYTKSYEQNLDILRKRISDQQIKAAEDGFLLPNFR